MTKFVWFWIPFFFEPNTTYLLGRGVAILSNKMSCKLRCEKLPTKIHSCWNFDGVFFSDFHWTNSCCIHGRLASWCLGKTLGFGSETIQKKHFCKTLVAKDLFQSPLCFAMAHERLGVMFVFVFGGEWEGFWGLKPAQEMVGFWWYLHQVFVSDTIFFVVKAGTSNVEVL